MIFPLQNTYKSRIDDRYYTFVLFIRELFEAGGGTAGSSGEGRQRIVPLKATLLENIRYGKPDATPEEVDRAVNMAQCRNVIDRQPLGLNARIGAPEGLLAAKGIFAGMIKKQGKAEV